VTHIEVTKPSEVVLVTNTTQTTTQTVLELDAAVDTITKIVNITEEITGTV